MKRNIIVGLHTFYHDGSIATYDLDTREFKYLKFERITGSKKQYHDDLVSWVKYLEHLGYSIQDVNVVFLVNVHNIVNHISSSNEIHYELVDHHECHHHSTSFFNSLVLDDMGSQQDSLSIFKKHKIKEKLLRFNNQGLGKTLDYLWWLWFKKEKEFPIFQGTDYAGHTMALAAFGKDYSNKIKRQVFDKNMESLNYFLEKNKDKDYEENCKNYVASLHFYWFKKIKNLLKKHFHKNEYFSGSGGVGENIILNTLIKNEYPNFSPSPHCADEGTSIGALRYGLKYHYKTNTNINIRNIHQHDENFGYAKIETIQKVAELLNQGKLVMWGQGWGEVGPRALGFRSILMNPCIPNAKEIINDKIKKRIWFRPYGASVPKDSLQKYFDLNYESPWMLFQAKVKDPIKFKNITHVDGTCRIQTVDSYNPTFLKLLKEFEKISGFPVLINTSMNLPGKPIIGTKKDAKDTFNSSQADVLIVGDEVYLR